MLPINSDFTLPTDYTEYYNKTWRLVPVSEEDKDGRPTERPMVLDDLRLFFWETHDDEGNVTADSDIIEYSVRSDENGNVTMQGIVPYPSDYYDTVTSGYVDGVDALIQTMFIILSTERYKFPIYSFDFGVELVDLFGKPIPFVIAEIPRRITEALTQDNRIDSCSNFLFAADKNKLRVQFTANTIYGAVGAEMGVTV
jgi:hypothetical protein